MSFTLKEDGGKLNQDSGAIAARTVRINSAAVGQISEAFERLLNDTVRWRLTKLCDEPDTTGVVFLFPV